MHERRSTISFLAPLLTLTLFTAPVGVAKSARPPGQLRECINRLSEQAPPAYSNLKDKTLNKIYLWWMHQPDAAKGHVERRPKFLTQPGAKQWDKADPTAPVKYLKPDGQTHYAIRSSPQLIESGTLENILRGGAKRLDRQNMTAIKLVFKDGTVMFDPDHPKDFRDYALWATWDNYLVAYPKRSAGGLMVRDAQGEPVIDQYVGYGGTMIQPYKLAGDTSGKRLPDFLLQNQTRSRHAYKVEYLKLASGKFREVWTDQGSIFQGQPSNNGKWIDGDFFHGYGSRVFTDEKGFPWLDSHGYSWMVYDRVTEQRTFVGGDGKAYYQPYKTEIRARRMKNPFQTFAQGELMIDGVDASVEIEIGNVAPFPEEGKGSAPYSTTDRGHDAKGLHRGYLEEGLNPAVIRAMLDHQTEKKFYVGLSSSGNFTDDSYTVNVRFRDAEAGPIGHSLMVMGQDGKPQAFGTELRALGIHWGFARGDFFYDHEGRGWIVGHGISKADLPKGAPTSGWPNDWKPYVRQDILLPAQWRVRAGQPWLVVEFPALNDKVIEDYFRAHH